MCARTGASVVWDSKIIQKEPLEKHKECLDAFAYNEVRMGLGGLMTISTEGTQGQVPAQSGCSSKFLITIKKNPWHTAGAFSFPSPLFCTPFFFLYHIWSGIPSKAVKLVRPVEFQKEIMGICTRPSGKVLLFGGNIWQIKGEVMMERNKQKELGKWSGNGLNELHPVYVCARVKAEIYKTQAKLSNTSTQTLSTHCSPEHKYSLFSVFSPKCGPRTPAACVFVWSVTTWRIEKVHRDTAR